MVHTGKVAEHLKGCYIGVIIRYILSNGESSGKSHGTWDCRAYKGH